MDSLALVTGLYSRSELYDTLLEDDQRRAAAGISQLHLIGDAHAPGLIAQAVFAGHRLARERDSPDPDVPLPVIRERRLVAEQVAIEHISAEPGGAQDASLTNELASRVIDAIP